MRPVLVQRLLIVLLACLLGQGATAAHAQMELIPVTGSRLTAVPGTQIRPVLQFTIVNHGAVPDTIRQLAITNLTNGPDTASQDLLDAEWRSLSVIAWNRPDPTSVQDDPAALRSGWLCEVLSEDSP